jgi:hypothetical protein
MPVNFALTPDQLNGFQADQWAQKANAAVADAWQAQQVANLQPMPVPAPPSLDVPTSSDSLTQPMQAAPQPAPLVGTVPEGTPSTDASVPPPVAPSAPPPVTAPLVYPGPRTPPPTLSTTAPVTAPLVYPGAPPPTQQPIAPAPPPSPDETISNPFGEAFRQLQGITQPQAPAPPPPTPTWSAPTGSDTLTNPIQTQANQATGGDLESLVRDSAARYGIDPDTAVRVAMSEGGLSEGARPGDSGSSFGPFQLHYGDVASGGNAVSGLGDAFTAATGLDARDPNNAAAAIDYALSNVAKSGWGPFHGAARVGIGPMDGIGGRPSNLAPTPSDSLTNPLGSGPAARTSQFGLGLSAQAAYAACGPAAAIAFANTYGRYPTPSEAMQLASSVGWSADSGMAGVSSEQQLLGKMGIPTKLESTVDWNHVAADAANGNPVILDTPGHYFYVSGVRQGQNGLEFNVGTSGTDLKGGGQWMSAAQINGSGMGSVRAALYADNPTSATPSVAAPAQPSTPGPAQQASQWMTKANLVTGVTPDETISNPFGDALRQAGNIAGGIGPAVQGALGPQPLTAAQQPTPSDTLTNPPLSTVPPADRSTVPSTPGATEGPIPPGIPIVSGAGNLAANAINTVGDAVKSNIQNDPSLPAVALRALTGGESSTAIQRDLMAKYGTWIPDDRFTPEDRERAGNLVMLIGGMELGGGKEAVDALGNKIAPLEEQAAQMAGRTLEGGAGLLGLGRPAGAVADVAATKAPPAVIAEAQRIVDSTAPEDVPHKPWAQDVLAQDAAAPAGPGPAAPIRATEQGAAAPPVEAQAATPVARTAAAPSVEPVTGATPEITPTAPPTTITNALDHLVPPGAKASPVEQALDRGLIVPRETGPVQILGPRGEVLSTVARQGQDVGIVRSAGAGAEVAAPTAATVARMPNIAKLAPEMPEVAASLQRVAEENPQLMDAYTQGKITHQQLVEDLAPKLGMTAAEFQKSPIGKAYNPQELLTLRAAVVQKQVQAARMAADIAAKGGVEALTPTQKAEYIAQIVDAARLQAVGRGAAATAGRTLNQQKIVINQEMAQAITGGNEARAAKAAADAAEARLARAQKLAANNTQLATEKANAVRAAQRITSEARAARPASTPQTSTLLDKIAKAYDDLAAYHAMSIDEKGADLATRDAQRVAAAAKRAEALKNTSAPQELLDALNNELAAERGYFKTTKAAGDRTAADAAKRLEGLKQAGVDKPGSRNGPVAWLDAEAQNARRDANLANRRSAAAFDAQSRVASRQTEQAGRLLEKMGGKAVTDDVLKQFVAAQQSGNPLAAAKFLQSLQHVSWWDRISMLRYASMLSATTTHLTNALGNTIQGGLDVGLKPLAVGIDAARAAVTGGPRTRYMGEIAPQLRGMAEGAVQGLGEALTTLRTGVNPQSAGKLENVRGGFQSGSSKLDAAVEMPLRALEASDLVFRGAARGGATRAIVARRAIQEGYTGQALRARMDEIMQNLPEYPAIMAEADKTAAHSVLQEPNALASAFSSIGRGPGPKNMAARIIRELVVPFTKTPANILAQGLELSPAGAIDLLQHIRAGDTGAAADSGARVLFGSSVIAGTAALAAHGLVTGGYPADPKERDTLPTGWQPWSLKIPDGQGNFTYIDLSKLGPLSIPLAIGAVVGQSQQEGSVSDPTRLAVSLGKFMTDQTFLQGLNAVMNAVQDPKRYSENVTEQLATSFVPYASFARQMTRALGQADRNPKGAIQAIEALIPGVAENVPRRQNALGQDIQSDQTGAGAFISPLKYSSSQPEPILNAFRDVGMGIPNAPTEIRVKNPLTGSLSPPMTLTEAEKNTYQQKFGELLQQRLNAQVTDPNWQRRTPEARKKVLEVQTQAARDYAEAQVYAAMAPTDRQARMAEGRIRLLTPPKALPAA